MRGKRPALVPNAKRAANGLRQNSIDEELKANHDEVAKKIEKLIGARPNLMNPNARDKALQELEEKQIASGNLLSEHETQIDILKSAIASINKKVSLHHERLLEISDTEFERQSQAQTIKFLENKITDLTKQQKVNELSLMNSQNALVASQEDITKVYEALDSIHAFVEKMKTVAKTSRNF